LHVLERILRDSDVVGQLKSHRHHTKNPDPLMGGVLALGKDKTSEDPRAAGYPEAETPMSIGPPGR